MSASKSCTSVINLLCLVLFLSTALARGATIRVPADQATIQAGINAASTGDTVLVAPGTYYENIDFKGKAITVTSSDGAAKTIIDGSNGQNPTVVFRNKEAKSSILYGFTIEGGGTESYPTPQSNYGTGGILIQQGSPTISHNVITHNHCNGIQSNSSSPFIDSNEIDNTLDAGQCGFAGGSAIWLSGSLSYYNGGVGMQTLPAIVAGNVIQNNVQSGRDNAGGNGGAAIAVWGAYAFIVSNTLRNNVTAGDGGAILAFNTNEISIVGNLIYGNKATVDAAISLHPPGSSLGPYVGVVASNTIYGNTQTSLHGGGLGLYDTPPTQVYLSGNLAQYLLVNNIIVGSGQSSVAVACGAIYNYLSATPLVFDHNDIYNPDGAAYGGTCPDQTGTYGNISADPRFASPATGDFHLLQSSPTIDAGNNSAPLLTTTDFDGNPRLADATGKGYPIVDMGAYEYVGLQNANPTALILTPSTYQTSGGGSLTLTAKLTSANGIPTGPVTFFEDGTQIGVSLIDGTGTATFAPQGLVPGPHAFIATYAGEGSFTAAVSVKFYVLIDKYIPTLKLTSSANPSLLNQPVTITVTATSPDNIVLAPITLMDGQTTLTTLTPNSNGVATFTTSSFTLGIHYLNATYAGDATHGTANASLNQVVSNGYPTPSTLTSSLNPATIGQSVTFTDTVTFNGSASTSGSGTITFYDNNGATLLGTQTITAQPNTAATATFTTSTLVIGTHNISAVLTSANAYASTATLNQVILGVPTTTALAASPNPADALQPVTLTATVSSAVTTPALTGSVTFYDGNAALGSSPLDATGHASFTTTTLAGGTHLLHAVYSGDNTFASSTSFNVSETIRFLPSITTLSISPSTSVAQQPVTATVRVSPLTNAPYSSQFCGCTVTVTIAGLAPNVAPAYTLPVHEGIATFNFGLGFPAGTYTFSAAFNGSAAFAPSNSSTVQQIVVPAPTALTLTASPNPVVQRQTVNFTAIITAPLSAIIPPGVITFFDGATPIGSAPFGTAGPIPVNQTSNTATVSIGTNTLSAGTHTITASYPGTSSFLPVTSAPLTVTVTPQDFAIAVSNTAMTIQTEHHLTTNVTLTSIGAFADKLTLSCANLPPHASCTFDANSIQLLPNGTATAKLTVDTDDVLGFRAARSQPQRPGKSSPITFALLLPVGFLSHAALSRKRRTLPRLLLLIVATFAATLSITGCDGLYPASTAPGVYTIQVTARGTETGLSHATPITLIVTK